MHSHRLNYVLKGTQNQQTEKYCNSGEVIDLNPDHPSITEVDAEQQHQHLPQSIDDDMRTVYIDPKSHKLYLRKHNRSSSATPTLRSVLPGDIKDRAEQFVHLLELRVKRSTIEPLLRKIPLDTPIQSRGDKVRRIFMENAVNTTVRMFRNTAPGPARAKRSATCGVAKSAPVSPAHRRALSDKRH